MALPTDGKLVRDLIPSIVSTQGASYDLVTLEDCDMWEALNLKLVEEAQELHAADGDHRIEELADVYEVLLALASAVGVSMADVSQAARAKREERGGFGSRIWMSNYSPAEKM